MKIKRLLVNTFKDYFGLDISYSIVNPTSYEAKIYNEYLPNVSIDLIFDVGANIGQSAASYSNAFPESKIYSFEPFEKCFHILKEKSKNNKNIIAEKIALSNRIGRFSYLSDNNPESQINSLTETRQSTLGKNKDKCLEEIVETTGDSYCQSNKIQRINILKIDTEGFEMNVLHGFSDMLNAGKIDSILIEVGFHNDSHHGNYFVINDFLTLKKMVLVGFYEVKYTRYGRCNYANALFIKKPGSDDNAN